jgi:hypothetical protein
MCFDGTGNRLILFGGVSPTPSLILNETWAFNGTVWTQLFPLGGAPGRWGHQMVRSTVSNRIVTFGGRSPTISGFANDSYLWSGSVWSLLPASNPPPPRYLYGMAYDSGRDKIVVFGGRGSLATLGDTWELTINGVTGSWQQILTPTSPPPREEMVMAYMPDLRRTVMFGGYDRDTDTVYGDTWDYDGVTWHAVTPATSPTPRYRTASAYDTARRRITVYGGFDGDTVRTETFEYTGANWQQISVGPGSLNATEMYAAYDSTRRRFVTFGGVGTVFSNQTFEFNASCTASFSQFGNGCPTSVGVGTVAATNLPRLGQTYTMEFSGIPLTTPGVIIVVGLSNTSLSGIPLPLELSVIGLPGCNLLCSAEVFQVVTTTSGLATFGVAIPNTANLINMPLYSQALIPDPLAPNASGGASRGGVGVIGN